MLINFFLTLRKYKVPFTIPELMDLLMALEGRPGGLFDGQGLLF